MTRAASARGLPFPAYLVPVPVSLRAVRGGRRLGQAVGEHGDQDISATYLASAPEPAA